jgi:hypothetical protein
VWAVRELIRGMLAIIIAVAAGYLIYRVTPRSGS